MATTYANGSVPAGLLAPLDGQPEASLRADAAAAWNRARADVRRQTGITLRVRGWNRTLAEQERFYLQRHRLARPGEGVCCRWKGRPYVFTGTAHAAAPGTSNHGWGLAVDVEDFGAVGQFNHPRRVKAFPILAAHGWTDTEGRGAIREPWHLVYDPARDTRPVSRPVPGADSSITIPTIPGRPAPLEEDDMYTETDRARDAESLRLLRLIVLAPSGHATPATPAETVYVQTVRGDTENAAEGRRQAGVLLGAITPAGPEQTITQQLEGNDR